MAGWARQFFINTFIKLDDIKKGIPEYADAIILEMTKPVIQRQIKAILNKQLNEYSEQTFGTQDTSQLRDVLLRTGFESIETARSKVGNDISIYETELLRMRMC